MMRRLALCGSVLVALVGGAVVSGAAVRTVTESARDIPLAYDVDVVVVGGTSRGVAAAVAAKKAGASVFLAASRPYLGEDICATYRLWLEPGEEPDCELAEAMFSPPTLPTLHSKLANRLPFTYEASLAATARHPDPNNTRLTDRKHQSASQESAQYDGDVSIVADLGRVTDFAGIDLVAFFRMRDFGVGKVIVSISDDQKEWSVIDEVEQRMPTNAGDYAMTLSSSAAAKARYVKLDCERGSRCGRILLGELIIGSTEPADVPAASKERRATTPMTVKRVLDEALLDANIEYLYGSYVTEVLRDPEGKLAGIVMANRSGRQAVRGKVIIDATDRAVAARIAGAAFAPYPGGMHVFSRIVVGGEPGDDARDTGLHFHVGGMKNRAHAVYEHKLELPMRDGSWGSFVRADQEARNRTWQMGQAAASERLFQVPPDPLKSRRGGGRRAAEDAFPLDALRPAKVDGLYVLGGCADVSRELAAGLMRPIQGIRLGRRVGAAAAAEAKSRKRVAAKRLVVGGVDGDGSIRADVGEMLDGLRWRRTEGSVHSPARGLPVLARYDTVVVGGGTGGAPAGIGAARGGARTLVIEYLHGFGGVGTLGRIAKYYHGNRVGFTSEVDEGVESLTVNKAPKGWNIEAKMEWLRSELGKAGGDVWFQSLGVGSVVEGKRFTGVVVATPFGRGVVMANTVIDATGNAVIPACTGLETQRITGEHMSVQGTGLPPMTPGESYQNSDWTFVDDDDVLDMWRIHVVAKNKYRDAFDLGQLIDTRARRRIVGDTMITPMDIINKRVYPDVITVSKSNFDNHGFSSHDIFMVTPPDKRGLVANVPYRALMPRGYDGILVIGLGMSAHGDAMPVLRMQPDVQNHGYAAGRASAMAAAEGTTARNVDIKGLQDHLVEVGIIPEAFIGAKDSYPIGPERMGTAVESIGRDYTGIAQVLTQPGTAVPLLREAWKKTDDEAAKLRYAHVLGLLRDGTGSTTLIKAVGAAEWDKGWNFRGMGQFGATTSPVDNLVIALGRTGDKGAIPVLVEKTRQLTPESEFSHCRAVAMAFESIRDPRAAEPLADLLQKPGIGGHAFLEIQDVIERSPASMTDNSTRNNSLRELILARALYRCGDRDGLGERILTKYASDYRGHYATHARAVLAGGSSNH